jgi:hypothetical protein
MEGTVARLVDAMTDRVAQTADVPDVVQELPAALKRRP